MAIITTSPVIAEIVKGTSATFTLSKSNLAAVTSVETDLYYSDITNWKSVRIVYRSSTGNQREIVNFDATQATPQGQFLVSVKARNFFNVIKIEIEDFDGGVFTVPRSELTTSEFDVSFE
jgi:hypothetical protein